MFKNIAKGLQETSRELKDVERLFSPENKKLRELVFYGERDIFYRYYEDYIEYIVQNSDKKICYLSSDLNDPIFSANNNRITPFFVKNTLASVFARLDAKVLVMTTPDLNLGVIKRAPDTVRHVYAFHGISSLHQSYRLGAFDHFDALLCVAQYQIEETRKTESIYNLKAKELPLVGYPLVERIYREHQQWIKENPTVPNKKPICLLAPTWDPGQKASIMDCCIDQMLEPLSRSIFEVWLRPHPEYIKRFPRLIESIQKRLEKFKNITLQTSVGSMQCLHQADLLITDHSTIGTDYVIGTERPILYIDTPTRIDNPECDRLGIEPVENRLRSKMGATLGLTEINMLDTAMNALFDGRAAFAEQVPALREELVANWQQAGRIGAEYILAQCER